MAHFPVLHERFLQGAKTRKQLAGEYDMSRSTFYRHLKKHHLHSRLPSGLLPPADYIIVYQTLGPPVLPPVSMKPPATYQADSQARDRF